MKQNAILNTLPALYIGITRDGKQKCVRNDGIKVGKVADVGAKDNTISQ
jgi:hypothetical protein